MNYRILALAAALVMPTGAAYASDWGLSSGSDLVCFRAAPDWAAAHPNEVFHSPSDCAAAAKRGVEAPVTIAKSSPATSDRKPWWSIEYPDGSTKATCVSNADPAPNWMNAEEAKAYSEARTPASKAEDDPSRIIDHGGDEVDVVPDRALSAADPNAFADAIMTERFFRTHDACAKVAAGENAVRDAVDKADLEAKAARSRQLDPYR